MAKLTLSSLLSSFAAKSLLNNNFQAIEDELNNKVLYRDNPAGEANQMENVLDMNSNRVINVAAPIAQADALRLADIPSGTEQTSASFVDLADTAGYYDQTTVEGALQEIWDDLGSSANGEGASRVATEDSGGFYTSTDVETTFQEIGSELQDINSNSEEIVSDVATLRATSFDTDFDRIWLSGYYGVGTDGGGSLYRDSGDTTTADNGGTVFVDADGVRWKRDLPLADIVSVEMFGAVGDSDGTNANGTDDWAAFDAACNLTIRGSGEEQHAPMVVVGEKIYRLSQTLNLKKIVKIQGQGGNIDKYTSSILRFDDDTLGIVVNNTDSLGDGLDPEGSTTSAGGSIIEGITLRGGGTDQSKHGLFMRSRAVLENFRILNFPGDNLHIVANSAGGAATFGNANNFAISNCRITGAGRDGLFASGTDVNAGSGVAVDCANNGRWGINDSSFLGNTWTGSHTSGNGTAIAISNITNANPAVVTTSVAHGLATGDRVFIDGVGGMTEVNDRSFIITVIDSTSFSLDGEDSTGYGAYTSGGSTFDGGAYYSSDSNAHATFIGAYAESGQKYMWLGPRSTAILAETGIRLLGDGYYVDRRGSPITRADEGALLTARADRTPVGADTYAVIFDVSGAHAMYGGSILGKNVGFRLTVDGAVVFDETDNALGEDSAGNAFSTVSLPHAIAENSMKLEAYNGDTTTTNIGWRVYHRAWAFS